MSLVNQVIGDIMNTVAWHYFLRVNRLKMIGLNELIGNDKANIHHVDQLIIAGLVKIEELDDKCWVVDVSERRDSYKIQERYMEHVNILNELIAETDPHSGMSFKNTLNAVELQVMHNVAGYGCATLGEIRKAIKEKDTMCTVPVSAINDAVLHCKQLNIITSTEEGFRLTWRA